MIEPALQEALSAWKLSLRRTDAVDERTGAFASLLPAWCLVMLGAVCVLAMLWTGMVGSRDCRVQPIPLALGTVSNISITMPADTPCTVLVSAPSTAVDAIAIDTAPIHGTVTPRGRTGAIYRPAPKYRGEDSFNFSIHGHAGTASGTAIVRVRATVR